MPDSEPTDCAELMIGCLNDMNSIMCGGGYAGRYEWVTIKRASTPETNDRQSREQRLGGRRRRAGPSLPALHPG
jgi:hypothetical protein